MMGDIKPFTGDKFERNKPGDILRRLVRATNEVCHVTWNDDGNLVGDCENCIKYLGYNCPAVTWVRNKHGRIKPNLNERTKVQADANGKPFHGPRNTNGMYESGKCEKRKLRSCHPMREDFDVYLNTLDHDTLVELTMYFHLYKGTAENPVTEQLVKQKTTKELRKVLHFFLEDTVAFRNRGGMSTMEGIAVDNEVQ